MLMRKPSFETKIPGTFLAWQHRWRIALSGVVKFFGRALAWAVVFLQIVLGNFLSWTWALTCVDMTSEIRNYPANDKPPAFFFFFPVLRHAAIMVNREIFEISSTCEPFGFLAGTL